MGMEDIVGEPDRIAVTLERKETPDRLIRGQTLAPDSVRDWVRDGSFECRSVAAPERQPRLAIMCLSGTDHQLC